MKRRFLNNDKTFDRVVTVLVTIILIAIFYPLFFIVIASFSDPTMIANGKVIFFPKGFNVEGYEYIFQDKRIWIGYYNSIRYSFFGTLLALFITIPAGYALSRRDMKGKKVIMMFMIITMYFQGGLIPTYLVVKSLGLVNTPYILMILGSFSVFNLIITRTFYKSNLPHELQEAAEIDGCTIGQYFFHIVVPLSKPIIAIIALYYGVGHWNAFFSSLIYVTDNKLYPLQLILRDILISGQTIDVTTSDPEVIERLKQIARTIKYGVIIVSSLPVILVYPFVQKHFVKGVMIGSVK
ncbi:sugar ABC transporter permease [Vallitalea longa]|uniref:Sugar ABC transporter permease n=1 Tax=Vallitalea longa TaxID=2936439 RepID=A0A9W5Y8V4_9FIRM|nr:carbohydrate ABC transporter permease [Vallitalea longa]GKX29365.1 sugar ABC transporter permease [Vallitalea longa]